MPEPLEIPVEVDADKASRILDEFAADVEELQDRFQPVDVEVDTGDAVSDLDKVADAAKELDDLDPEIEVGADVSKAKKGLDDVGRSAHSTGLDVGELRDLGGPLDEAFAGLSGTAGDFGEAFQIAGGKIGSAVGLGEEAVGKLSSALGIGGLAIGAAVTLWGLFKQGAEDAKKATEDVIKAQEALWAGNTAQAAKQVVKDLGQDTIAAARELGVSTSQVFDFVTGATDQLGPLTQRVADLRAEWERNHELGRGADPQQEVLKGQFQALEKVTGKIGEYRDTWITQNGVAQETVRSEFEVAKAMDGTADAMLDLAKTVNGPTREAILRHIAAVEGIPTEIISNIIADADPDDIAQTKQELDRLANQPRTATISVRADTTQLTSQVAAAVRSIGAQVANFGASATTSGVQQYQARNGPIS